tara:strand:- start:1117 stop:1476 length:360 start_codon:yes stop_codon:yes gene_type:complete
MNNVTPALSNDVSYNSLMEGLDYKYVFGRAKGEIYSQYFKLLEKGDFKLVGSYKVLKEARKVQARLRSHMYSRNLTEDFHVAIQDVERNNKVVFVLGVCKLTDKDKAVKKERIKHLQRR